MTPCQGELSEEGAEDGGVALEAISRRERSGSPLPKSRAKSRDLARVRYAEVTPAGYMAKHVQKPKGFNIDQVTDVYSVSSCVNDDFADYINFWKHNGYWLFDSPEIIRAVARENSISIEGTSLFFYEVHQTQFDGESWAPFEPDRSFETNVLLPPAKAMDGFDVVTFHAGNAPEHSPLSCNNLARVIRTNVHCLFDSFDEAYASLTNGKFNHCEPGPYRIFAVYSTPWPSS